MASPDARPRPGARPRNVHTLLKARLPARLFQILRQAGTTGDRQQTPVYAVGGFVRDLLLNTPTGDVDLVVEGRGIRFAKTFAQHHKARVTAHERFGTATVTFADGHRLDIATARTERYARPAALPTVTPGTIGDDLARRDFTINALAVRLNPARFGDLVDVLGGERDLRGKTIRVLHERSFIEDPTRAFRAIRFEQRLGFRLSRDTARLLREAARRRVVRRLSPSRLSDAVIHVLSERDPGAILAGLADFDLLHDIHPRLRWSPAAARLLKDAGRVLARHTRIHPDRPVQPWVVYGMAVMSTLPRPAVNAVLARLPFPRRQAHLILQAMHTRDRLLPALAQRRRVVPLETIRLLRTLPDETLIFLRAAVPSATGKRRLSALLAAAQRATPVLTGHDLRAMGLTPGPLYTRILNRLWDARLKGAVTTETGERRLVARLTRPS